MTRDQHQLTKCAEAAVNALEALPVGDAFDEASAAAGDAIAELRDRATAEIFTTAPTPVGADLLSDFHVYAEGAPVDGYGESLAQLHLGALDSYPDLACFLRSANVAQRIRFRAGERAVAHARTAAEFSAETLEEYRRLIAAQLHSRGEHEPFSGILAEEVPALEVRLLAARQPHEAHAAEEGERARQDRLTLRGELVEQFRRLGPSHKFCLKELRNGARIGADEVASALAGGTWDMHLQALGAHLATLPAGLRDRAGVPA